MKFTTISKIPNISQMLIIPFLSMHYIYLFMVYFTLWSQRRDGRKKEEG